MVKGAAATRWDIASAVVMAAPCRFRFPRLVTQQFGSGRDFRGTRNRQCASLDGPQSPAVGFQIGGADDRAQEQLMPAVAQKLLEQTPTRAKTVSGSKR